MQVGEAVGFGEVYMPVEDCPFDHNAPKPPTVKNDLVGVGKTLASRMKVGSSAILYKDLNPGQQAIVKNPRAIPGHPFYDKQNCVEVQFTNEKKKSYPVTCAAHHLVPAQESLKGSSLLAYMCKKSSSEEHN